MFEKDQSRELLDTVGGRDFDVVDLDEADPDPVGVVINVFESVQGFLGFLLPVVKQDLKSIPNKHIYCEGSKNKTFFTNAEIYFQIRKTV